MGHRRKCQTYTASPAEPGGLPVMLAAAASPSSFRRRPRADRAHVAAGEMCSIKICLKRFSRSYKMRTSYKELTGALAECPIDGRTPNSKHLCDSRRANSLLLERPHRTISTVGFPIKERAMDPARLICFDIAK